jgi:hypothetical protein
MARSLIAHFGTGDGDLGTRLHDIHASGPEPLWTHAPECVVAEIGYQPAALRNYFPASRLPTSRLPLPVPL